MKRSEVLILNPPRYKGMNVRRDERSADICEGEVSPFYVGALLAEWLRKENGCTVHVLDANGLGVGYDHVREWIDSHGDAEYVIIKAADDTLLHDGIAAALAKGSGKKAVLWEPIFSPAMPDRVMKLIPELDYLILGEPELTVSDLIVKGDGAKGIAFRSEGGVKINPRSEEERLMDLDRLPIPNFRDLPVKNYRAWFGEGPWMMLFSSRGCVGECSYCLVGGSTCFRGYGRKVRFFSPERVVDEMEILVRDYGVKHISFWDDCFTSDVKRLSRICSLIESRNLRIKWSCMSRVDSITADTLRMMRKAGLRRIGFGLESGSQRVLDSIPKHVTPEQCMNAIKTAKSLGLWVWVFALLGLPEDDEESLEETIRFIKKARPHEVLYGMLMPFPGTRMHDECQRGNLLREDMFERISGGNVPTGGATLMGTRRIDKAILDKYLKRLSRTVKFYPPYALTNFSQLARALIERVKKTLDS